MKQKRSCSVLYIVNSVSKFHFLTYGLSFIPIEISRLICNTSQLTGFSMKFFRLKKAQLGFITFLKLNVASYFQLVNHCNHQPMLGNKGNMKIEEKLQQKMNKSDSLSQVLIMNCSTVYHLKLPKSAT